MMFARRLFNMKPFISTLTAVAVLAGTGLFSSSSALAKKNDGGTKSGTGLSPEALGAKAFLEDLLARRYSAELGTIVGRDQFSLGAQLDLTMLPAPTATPLTAPKDDKQIQLDPLSDLMLGSLDADALLKSYVGSSPLSPDQPAAQRLLSQFKIKSATISVGLKETLDPKMKGEVEAWVAKRVKAEFGSAGKTTVTFINEAMKPKIDPQAPPNYIELLDQFQALAGQVVIALAIILGMMLYRASSAGAEPMAGGPSSEAQSDLESLRAAAAEVAADNEKENEENRLLEEADRVRIMSEFDLLRKHVVELVPRLSGYMEDVIRTWCHMGDAGRLRLACFAEVAGRDTGKLPIPVDALQDVQRTFAKMTEVPIREKREALQKAYWDLLSTLNLGSESLSQPFSYLDGINVTTVNRMLMGQNSRMRTVVSLYMNDELRQRFMQNLSPKAKKEMLEAAAGLNEIRSDELETLDRGLHSRFNPAHGQEIVPLEHSFGKIVKAIPLLEGLPMLMDMKGDVVDEYKRTTPSLAFVHEWPDDKLQILLMGVTPDELISYLRLRPDLQERFLKLASMMVGEIATDELSRPDKSSPADKAKALEFFTQRLRDLVEQGDVNLEAIFGPAAGNVIMTDEGNGNESQAA